MRHDNALERLNELDNNSAISELVYHEDMYIREKIDQLKLLRKASRRRGISIQPIIDALHLLAIPEHCIDLIVRSCGPDTFFITITFRYDYLDPVLINKTIRTNYLDC